MSHRRPAHEELPTVAILHCHKRLIYSGKSPPAGRVKLEQIPVHKRCGRQQIYAVVADIFVSGRAARNLRES